MVSKKINAVFAFTFVLAMILVVSSVSAAPIFSEDFENSGWASDWYQNNGVTRDNAGSNDYAEFRNGDFATILLNLSSWNNAYLSFDWRSIGESATNLDDDSYVQYSLDGSSWVVLDDLESHDEWQNHLVTQDLKDLSSGLIYLRFIFDNDGLLQGGFDLDDVLVSGEIPFIAYPVCSVDYLRGVNGNSYNFNLSQSLYLNQIGAYDVYGYNDAGHEDCNIVGDGSYNRTSPSPFIPISSWEPAGTASFLNFDWHTTYASYSQNYLEGNHTVCCQVISEDCDDVCRTFTNESCTTFCIDTKKPIMDGVDHSNGCTVGYINTETTSLVWNWSAHDIGCANVKQYNLTLYNATSGAVFSYIGIVNSTSIGVGLSDGSYILQVVPIDNAGNIGDAMNSSIIIVDTIAPVVTIQSPLAGWYNNASNLWLNETDVDVNLVNCSVMTNQSYSSAVGCNSNVSFDVDSYCPAEGACLITKTAEDRACNIGTNNVVISLDRLPPTTNKTALGNYYSNGSLMNYMNYMIHFFFGAKPSALGFTCGDGFGSGCNYLVGTIKNETGSVIAAFNESYEGGIFHRIDFRKLVNATDGVYFVEYRSVDNVGNLGILQNETDKLDNIAPVTTKTWGTPNYWNGSALWVTSNTVFNLSCADSEVGCDNTYYNINDNEWNEGDSFYIKGEECGANFVEYYSTDLLGNIEVVKNETDWLDNNAPLVRIVNPSFANTSSCSMAVLAEILDSCVGINESSVYVTLYYENGSVALRQLLPRTGNLNGVIFGGKPYSALLNTTGLPAGSYTLMISAADLLGNVRQENRTIVLNQGIYVEYVSPSSCSITPGYAGNCSFTLNTCIRDSDSVSMWMDKLNGGKVSPTDVDATLWNMVGQSQEIGIIENNTKEFDPQPLRLNITSGCQNFNGWYKFNMTLGVPANVSALLGGKYTINYTLSSYDEYECASITDSDGDGVANAQDNCPSTANSNQVDMDGDHVGDVCDNCVFNSNADQADMDSDGSGDVCDI